MPQSISAEPLTQMVRSIALQKRTGILRVEQLGGRSVERGEIYFENGSLVRVRTGWETGKAALQRINEWKQITCSFQSMSRPYPTTTPIPALPHEPRVENPPARPLPETDRLARMPEMMDTGPRKSVTSQPLPAREKHTDPLHPRQVEIALSTGAGSSMLPEPTGLANQPLILHGTRLEAYTPAQPASPSRSVQRWTTHQDADIETLPMPHRPPPTPRLGPLPGEEVLPGRTAIFKARSTVSTAQAIGQMDRRARIVFILLDERRTIQDIARLTHQAEYEVEQTLVNLTQRGYTLYVRG